MQAIRACDPSAPGEATLWILLQRGREARTVLFKQHSNSKHKVTLWISHKAIKLSQGSSKHDWFASTLSSNQAGPGVPGAMQVGKTHTHHRIISSTFAQYLTFGG